MAKLNPVEGPAQQEQTLDVSAMGRAGLVLLPPDEILADPVGRRYAPADDQTAEREQRLVMQLADSILRDGQAQPVLVRPAMNGDGVIGGYLLVSGNRRLAAAKMAGFNLLAMVMDLDDDQADRIALAENIKRRNLSAIELANKIAEVRSRKGWQGADHTAQVAEYFGVSPAQITQHEKLVALPEDIQGLVHRREMTVDAAYTLLKVPAGVERDAAIEVIRGEVAPDIPEELPHESLEVEGGTETTSEPQTIDPGQPEQAKNEVYEVSDPLSDEGVPSKGKSKSKGKPLSEGLKEQKRKHAERIAKERAEKAAKPAAAKTPPKPIGRKHVEEITGAVGRSRTRAEILEFFQEKIETPNGYPKVMISFAKHLVEEFASGKAESDRGLNTRWSQIATAIDSNSEDAGNPNPNTKSNAGIKKQSPRAKGKK